MKKTETKSLGMMLIAVGMFFLINPTVNIIDVIPDFIGYLFIISGLDRLADMEDHFAGAKKNFVLLAVISAAKTVSCLLLPVIDGTFVILLSFVFSILEALFFIPAVVNVFGGFHYYGLRLESKACYGIYKSVFEKDENGNKVKAEKRVCSSDSVMAFTIVAFIVRALCYFLPQVPTLFSYGDSAVINGGYRIEWTYFIPHMYFLCGVLVLAVCLPWALRFARYIKGIANDEKLVSALEKSYMENIAPNVNYFAGKKTVTVSVLTIVAAVFSFSIYVDYVNWLPSGAACLLFAVAALMLRKTSKFSLPTIFAGFIGVVPSVLEVVWQYQYAEMKYTPASFLYGIGKSGEMYPRIIIAEAIAAICLIVTVWLFAKCLGAMTEEHCVLYEKSRPETRGGRGKALCNAIMKEYKISFALMTAMAVVSGAHGLVAVYYPEIWILNIVIGVAMAIFLLRAINLAKDELYDKLNERV
ncbi:MAG: hypothetical protein IKL36_06120 [Clostridia bacterium]|nr:hypothetical protein [Clostridia bacterium]